MMVFPFEQKHQPISGFVGVNGAGKTAVAVNDAIEHVMPRRAHRNILGQMIPAREAGTIYSNVPVTPDPSLGIRYERIDSIWQFWDRDAKDAEHPDGQPRIRNGHVLIDEINAVFPSRETSSLPSEVTLLLQTLRKYGLTFSWTSPSFEHADINIRRISNSVTALRPIIRVEQPGSTWPRTVVSTATQYDLTSYVEDSITENTPVMNNGFVRMKSLRLDNYDTMAPVAMINDHLLCKVCGLKTRTETCRGHKVDGTH